MYIMYTFWFQAEGGRLFLVNFLTEPDAGDPATLYC